MSIKATNIIPLLVLLLLCCGVHAQSTYQFGCLPAINLNKKLKNEWYLNAKTESRQLFQQGKIKGTSEKEYQYLLTDFSLIGAKNVGLNSRIAAGYLFRIEKVEFFHRFIQQFTIVQKMSGFRLAHRISSDQTFSKAEKPEIRFRYRITSEIPLNGTSVDQGEFYLKLNNEYVNSLQANTYNLEIRFIPLLGYDLTERFKIESGMDYRLTSFLNNGTRHSYWMTLNLFIDL